MGTFTYSIVVCWHPEDKVFIAYSPEFGTTASAYGSTPKQAMKEFVDVLLPHLIEIYTETGMVLPCPRLWDSYDNPTDHGVTYV